MAERLVIGLVCGLAGITQGAAVRRQVSGVGGVQTLNGVNFAPTVTAVPAPAFDQGVVQFNTGSPVATPTPIIPQNSADAAQPILLLDGGNQNTTTNGTILNLNSTAVISTGVIGDKNDTNATRKRCFGSAQYDVVVNFDVPALLQALFSPESIFGPLLVVSHGKKGAVWKNGTEASDSLANYLATGALEELQAALKEGKKPAAHRTTALDSTTNLNGTVEGSIEVNETSSLFSALSRLEPSSGFFAGAPDADLCDMKKGSWVRNITLNIYLYEGGVDFGAPPTASSPNGATEDMVVMDGEADGVVSFDDTFIDPAQTAALGAPIPAQTAPAGVPTPAVVAAPAFIPQGPAAVPSPSVQFVVAPTQPPAPAGQPPAQGQTRQRRQQQAAPVGVATFPANLPAAADPLAQSAAQDPNIVTFLPPTTNALTGPESAPDSIADQVGGVAILDQAPPVVAIGTTGMPVDSQFAGVAPSTKRPIMLVTGSKDKASPFYGLPKKPVMGTIELYLTKTCISYQRPGKKTEKKPAAAADLPPSRNPPSTANPSNEGTANDIAAPTPLNDPSAPQQPVANAQQAPQLPLQPQPQDAPIAQPAAVPNAGTFAGPSSITTRPSFVPTGGELPLPPPPPGAGEPWYFGQVSNVNAQPASQNNQVFAFAPSGQNTGSMPPSGVPSIPPNQNAGSTPAAGSAPNQITAPVSANAGGPVFMPPPSPQPSAGGSGVNTAPARQQQGQFRSFGSGDQMVFTDFRN